MYDLRLNGQTTRVWCDMTHNGGAWTLVAALGEGSLPTSGATRWRCGDWLESEGWETADPSIAIPTQGTYKFMSCGRINAIRAANSAQGLAGSMPGYWATTPGSGDTGVWGAEIFARHDCDFVMTRSASNLAASSCRFSNWVYNNVASGTGWMSGGYWHTETSGVFESFMGHSNSDTVGTSGVCHSSGRGLGLYFSSLNPFHRGWCNTGAWGLIWVR